MDGAFYKIGSIIADIMILGILWLVLSIPIVTSGAATTALFYVTTRRVSNKDGYLFRDFFKSFKANFVQATVSWLIILAVTAVVLINVLNINVVGDMKTIVLPVQICMLIEIFLITTYIFPIIARFDMKFKETFKTAFFMANRHLLTSLLCIICAAAAVFLSFYYLPFMLVAMGAYAYAVSYLFMRVFKKYRPEIDSDTDEAVARENERRHASLQYDNISAEPTPPEEPDEK
jgi:uncharacterized membrane protein YesL